MRHTLAAVLIPLFFSSCVTFAPYHHVSYKLNAMDSCVVGDPVVATWNGYSTRPQPGVFYGYRSELIYAGNTKDGLHLLYREYDIDQNGSSIRPAFSFPVEYSLGQTNEITFRQFVIRVVDASSSALKFSVLRDNRPDGLTKDSTSTGEIDAHNSIDPKFIYDMNRRFLARISLINGHSYIGFLVGENEKTVYLSNYQEASQSASAFPKRIIAQIDTLAERAP